MKSLLNKIFKNRLAILLRNTLNVFPVRVNKYYLNKNISISDAFLFRTDNNFKTIFKYSDILKNFYNLENTSVIFEFYTKQNQLIKKKTINNLFDSNELIIDKNFLNGIEDYGIFYIFHLTKNKINEKIIISNRCYLGFSKNNNLASFVHGNTLAKYQSIIELDTGTDLIKNSFFLNQIYRVQTYFTDYSKSEIFFANPTSKKIAFEIKNIKYNLKSGSSVIVDITNIKNLEIKSNCYFFRPLIFNYKNDFIDVFHS